jgi:hypothetical protein
MSTLMPSPADTFRGVFEQIFFPYLAVDLGRLRDALRTDPKASTGIAIPLGGVDDDKREVLSASIRGLLSKVMVPDQVIAIIASSAPIKEAGLSQAFIEMAHAPGQYALVEDRDQLVWHEESLWPVAYSTLFEQLAGILETHGRAIRSRVAELEGFPQLSEYARHMPTHLHYAVASLAAWLAGAANVQYFAYFATQPQLAKPEINRNYAAQVGYTPDDAVELDESGIVALPASLVVPLLTAQGKENVFGALPIDEMNVANPPAEGFLGAPLMPGFVIDKYYRAPFRARPLEGYGAYGANDVSRDHYTAFYEEVEPVSHVRCKHYCAPVLEVGSLAEIRELIARIPIYEEPVLFLRGQPRMFTLRRTAGVRRLLFADSCAVEPSLTTSAARRDPFDYDLMHFGLRYFLELKLLAGPHSADDWSAALASPTCELDFALMALAQHYGLPSHGLDITTSPEVAVWFATNLLDIDGDGRAAYLAMSAADWPEQADDWPVVFVHQVVTHSLRGSLHDCHALDAFGFGALRPERQSARFFLGGHSDHQNRIAESVVCVLRLKPGDYSTGLSFDQLFPSPEEDAGYRVMLEFADFAGLAGDVGVLGFHAA